MTTWCSHCEQWSTLPVHAEQGDSARVLCSHCRAPLSVEGRYSMCQECGRYHRVDYEVCPFAVEGTAAPHAELLSDGKYTTEAQKRRPKKHAKEYYWQLYIDYTEKAAVEQPHQVEEPPHPADSGPPANGNRHSASSQESREGRPAPSGTDGASGHNGSNGSSNGHTPRAAGSHVDLAISDAAPVMLFDESEMGTTSTYVPQVTVQTGNYNEFDYELIQDPSRLAEVAEMLAGEKVLGIDTETTGLDPHSVELLLLQVSTLDKVYIVDCKRVVPLALKAILENPQVRKLAQNAKFEYEMLRQQTGITLNGIFDSMLAERLLTAGISREISLKAIAQKYIGATLDKTAREAFYKQASHGDAYLATEQLHYAARDAFIMIPIWQHQVRELKRHKLEQVAELEFRCIAAVGDMELAGVKIAEDSWRKIIVDVGVQRDKAQEELCELLEPASMQATMFGVPSINLNSNLQLMEAFTMLGVNLPDTMEATLVKFDHPAVAKLLEYRGHEKTLSAFGENVLSLINPKTGRIHPDFNQYGADTGRFSCLAGETMVSVIDGLKRIDTMQAGDTVLSSFGPKEVLNAWCNGVRSVLRIRLSDGRSIRLTPDHQVLSGDGATWREAGDLKIGDNMFLALSPADLAQSVRPARIDIDPAVAAHLTESSRAGVKPFVALYKNHAQSSEGLKRALERWGDLPELARARDYTSRGLHRVRVVSIEPDGEVPVYDLTIEGVSEFLANGIVVHNCTKPNVQQIPATSDFRKCFVAPEGYKLVTCDYSQCIAKDTWVSTENGWVRIQDHPHAISKAIAATAVLMTRRKYQLECTPDHRVLTGNGWVSVSELKPGDWVALSGDARWQPKALDDKSWLEGLRAADVRYNEASTIASFSQSAHSTRKELRTYITSTLGVTAREASYSVGARGEREFATGTGLRDKQEARLPLDKIGHVPSFLCGLFDANGTAGGDGISFATGSVGLARDVQMALLRFGVMSAIVSNAAGPDFFPEGVEQHQVRISDPVSLENFAKRIGYGLAERSYSPELETSERYHWDQVEGVIPSGREIEVFDLMDQPEQRFEASGFVVHNCELRILAELSGDPGFVGAFTSGQDLHTLTASQMFSVPLDQVQKPQRSAAKAINFGLAYGMGPGGLAPRLGVSLDEAKELIARYFKAYPGVQKWLDKAAKDSVRNGYSTTTLGRKRFYNIPDESLKRLNEDDWRKQIAAIERQGKNSPIQGCVKFDTRIFVRDKGYVQIREMSGQAVEVWDGNAFVRAYVAPSGEKQLVLVTLYGGHFIECSPDHKFLVADDSTQKHEWNWKRAAEITARDRVALTSPVEEWHAGAAMPRAVQKVAYKASASQLTLLQDSTGRWRAQLVASVEITDQYVEMYDVVNSESGQFMANGMIVHNSNADMTKLALIHLRTALKDWDARTVNTVHDEIVVEVRADQAEEVKDIVEAAMVRAGNEILKTVPVVAEASLADYWTK